MAMNEAVETAKSLENIDILLAFSFDLVARITPGIAFIFVYFPPPIKETSSTSLFDGVRILIVAYLIGITVIALITVFVVCHVDRRNTLLREELNIPNEEKKQTHLDQPVQTAYKLDGVDTLRRQ